MSKNSLSLLQQSEARTNVLNEAIASAVNLHAGGTAIVSKVDDDGREYLTATFKLKNPTKKASEIVVNDLVVAESLDRMRKADSLGEVSAFVIAKELANIADTDASKCGFDDSESLASAVLGKAKSTLANYKRIGLYFIDSDYHIKGAIPQETSVSLLNQLLSFVVAENENGEPDIRNVEMLFRYGIITPYMKQADYKKTLKSLHEFMEQESTKALYDFTNEEMQDFIKAFKEYCTPKKQEKQEQEKQEKKPEEITIDISSEPQAIIGQCMSRVTELEKAIEALGVSDDIKQMTATWLDNLYTTFSDMLTNIEQ